MSRRSVLLVVFVILVVIQAFGPTQLNGPSTPSPALLDEISNFFALYCVKSSTLSECHTQDNRFSNFIALFGHFMPFWTDI